MFSLSIPAVPYSFLNREGVPDGTPCKPVSPEIKIERDLSERYF